MPLGIKQNNNLLYLTLDVWQDLVFLSEQAYPAGYFAANIMNQDQATLQALIHYGGAISKEAEALLDADRDTFARLLPQVRSDVSALLDVLWTYPPFCFLDKSGELEVLDQYCRENMVDALMSTEAPYRDFFLHYLAAAFAIPWGSIILLWRRTTLSGDIFTGSRNGTRPSLPLLPTTVSPVMTSGM